MSVVDENMEGTLEMSKLPALQYLLERMEIQAGHVVANELNARAVEGDYDAEDEVGRQRLQLLFKDFHQHCTQVSREEELLAFCINSINPRRHSNHHVLGIGRNYIM